MTPDIDMMREFVKNLYVGDRWKRRVKEMPNSQVTAIYIKHHADAVKAEIRKRKQNPDIPF